MFFEIPIPEQDSQQQDNCDGACTEDQTSIQSTKALDDIRICRGDQSAADKGAHERAVQSIDGSSLSFHFGVGSAKKHIADSGNTGERTKANDTLLKPTVLEDPGAQPEEPEHHQSNDYNRTDQQRSPVSQHHRDLDGSHCTDNQNFKRHSLNTLENVSIQQVPQRGALHNRIQQPTTDHGEGEQRQTGVTKDLSKAPHDDTADENGNAR